MKIVIEWAVQVNNREPQSFGSGSTGENKARMFITENKDTYQLRLLKRTVTLEDWDDAN